MVKRFTQSIRLRSLLSLSVLAIAGQASSAEIFALEGFEGSFGWGTWATGVSADGLTVAGTDGGWPGVAMRWTSASGIQTIGIYRDYFDSVSTAVSADGKTVVGRKEVQIGRGPSTTYSAMVPFRWTEAGESQLSGSTPPNGSTYMPTGVSSDGSVIVGYGDEYSGGHKRQLWRWTETGVDFLGSLEKTYHSGVAVSSDGSVIAATGVDGAFRWTKDGGRVRLGDLPGGEVRSAAFGISPDGKYTVGYGSSNSGSEATRWSGTDIPLGLGVLPGGSYSWAYGVTADGSRVVGESHDGADGQAFLWTEEDGMVSLADRLRSQGVDLTGWSSLISANAITPDGRTIVGNGRYNGTFTTFVVRFDSQPVPEPGTLAALGLGIAALARRRRKA